MFPLVLTVAGLSCGAPTQAVPADVAERGGPRAGATDCDPNAPRVDCLDALTRPTTEADQVVLQAEAEREVEAFRGRLADLRAAEEKRQLKRESTATATGAVARLLGRPRPRPGRTPRRPVRTDLLPEPAGLIDPVDEVDATDDTDAPVVPETPLTVPSTSQSAGSERPKAGPADAPAAARATGPLPTPELYLRAARCVLDGDHARGRAALATYRRRRDADAAGAGVWALALTDATALLDRVTAEITHRKLAKPGPLCVSSQVRPVVALLRTLVGPEPSTLRRARGYSRALSRMEKELEVRAGLPRAD